MSKLHRDTKCKDIVWRGAGLRQQPRQTRSLEAASTLADLISVCGGIHKHRFHKPSPLVDGKGRVR